MVANDRGQTYIDVSSALVALSTAIVAVRIAARWVKSTLGWDDYVICISIVIAYSMLAEAVFWARDGGLGKHLSSLSIEKIMFQKCFFANEISYTLLVPSIKISILLLYRRIFPIRKFQIASWIVGGLVCSWCLAVFITVMLQCRPISLNWDKSQQGTCIDAKQFFFGNAISNLLIDVVILMMPIPMVLQLQLRTSQKLTILGIFLLGGFVCVASIMRVVTLKIFESNDTSYCNGSRNMDLRRALRGHHLRLSANSASASPHTMLRHALEQQGLRGSTGAELQNAPTFELCETACRGARYVVESGWLA